MSTQRAKAHVAKAERRWFRRFALVAVALLSCWGTWKGWRGYVRYRAEARLNEQDLWLRREDVASLGWSLWLEHVFGFDSRVGTVIGCQLEGRGPIKDLSPLSEFPSLRSLTLDASDAIEPGAAALESLSSVGPLRELEQFSSFYRSPLPTDFYRNLEHSLRLQDFTVRDSEFDDHTLRHLRNCRELDHLFIVSTRVHRGLNELSLSKLRQLDARWTKIDSAGLEGLRNSRQLERVWIGGTEVDDDGMTLLSTLPELNNVAINETRVTRVGVERLMRAPKMWLIIANDTSLTVEDAIELTHDRDVSIAVGPFATSTMVEAGIIKSQKEAPPKEQGPDIAPAK